MTAIKIFWARKKEVNALVRVQITTALQRCRVEVGIRPNHETPHFPDLVCSNTDEKQTQFVPIETTSYNMN